MSNDREKIIAEVRRDCEMARQYGRGVNITTAGSINDGSSLESMRTVMWAICEYGKY
jgi:uroporphyrinogen decarboxylase